MEYVDGPSPYAFALNNPLNYSDPMGLCIGPASIVCAKWLMSLLGTTEEDLGAMATEAGRPGREMGKGALLVAPNFFAHVGGMATGHHPLVHDFQQFGAIPAENKEQIAGQVIGGLALGVGTARASGLQMRSPAGTATGTPRLNLVGPRSLQATTGAQRAAGMRAAAQTPDEILNLGRGPLRPEAAQQVLEGDVSATPSGITGFVADAEVTSFGRVVGRGTVDVHATVEGIESGALKPRAIFQNRPLPGKTTPELPVRPPGYYQEFVHPTPGARGVGPQRTVRGQGGELYYTPDHYTTFISLN